MQLLFKRDQQRKATKVSFELWARIELDDDEKAIMSKYRFEPALLIMADQPGLLRNSLLFGLLGLIPAALVIDFAHIRGAAPSILLLIGAVVLTAFWRYHQKRETIYVKDLLHGRYFTCNSVIDLARKEAWLHTVVSYLRQVMESARHWDGAQRHEVEPLPKDEARQVIIKGL